MVRPRQVGSVICAIGFALFAVLMYSIKQSRDGKNCDSLFILKEMADTCRARLSTDGAYQRPKGKVVLSKQLTDKSTGIKMPRHKKFWKSGMTCLGVGVRAKSIAVAKVNVYAVGLYVETKPAKHALKKFGDDDPIKLRTDDSVFDALGVHNSFCAGFKKYLHLVFARSVSAAKVVDSLTALKGVNKETLDRFSKVLLDAIGNSIHKGESVSLGWEGKDKTVVIVRDELAGIVTDSHLPKALFALYLGSNPVAPAAKAAFAEGVPDFVNSK